MYTDENALHNVHNGTGGNTNTKLLPSGLRRRLLILVKYNLSKTLISVLGHPRNQFHLSGKSIGSSYLFSLT